MNKSQRETIAAIRHAYYDARALGAPNALDRALAIAEKGEREHRALGRRLGADVRSRAPVTVCAMLFVIKGFVLPRRSRSYSDRADFIAAYVAADETCRWRRADYLAFCRRVRQNVAKIDYVSLIEGRP